MLATMEITNSCGNKIKRAIHDILNSHMHMLYMSECVCVASAKKSKHGESTTQEEKKSMLTYARWEIEKRQYNVNNSGKNHALFLYTVRRHKTSTFAAWKMPHNDLCVKDEERSKVLQTCRVSWSAEYIFIIQYYIVWYLLLLRFMCIFIPSTISGSAWRAKKKTMPAHYHARSGQTIGGWKNT